MERATKKYMEEYPTPWRVEVAPKGWDESTVIFASNGNACRACQ